MANSPTKNARSTAEGVDPIEPSPDAKATPANTAPSAAAPAEPAATQNDESPNLTKQDDDKALPGNGATAKTDMIKVKTKEDVVLMDPFSARHIDINGAEVPVTSFILDETAEGGRLEKM